MEKTEKRFNTRAFVTLMIALSGLGLPITGIANHIYGFADLNTVRHAWMSAHNVLGLVFIVFSVWHVALNRRAMANYAGRVAHRLPSVSREAVLAGVVVTLVLAIFTGHALHR